MKLTKSLIQKHEIEIESQMLDCIALPRPITLYTVKSEILKVNWSGIGSEWLRKAKKDLLAIIELQ